MLPAWLHCAPAAGLLVATEVVGARGAAGGPLATRHPANREPHVGRLMHLASCMINQGELFFLCPWINRQVEQGVIGFG